MFLFKILFITVVSSSWFSSFRSQAANFLKGYTFQDFFNAAKIDKVLEGKQDTINNLVGNKDFTASLQEFMKDCSEDSLAAAPEVFSEFRKFITDSGSFKKEKLKGIAKRAFTLVSAYNTQKLTTDNKVNYEEELKKELKKMDVEAESEVEIVPITNQPIGNQVKTANNPIISSKPTTPIVIANKPITPIVIADKPITPIEPNTANEPNTPNISNKHSIDPVLTNIVEENTPNGEETVENPTDVAISPRNNITSSSYYIFSFYSLLFII